MNSASHWWRLIPLKTELTVSLSVTSQCLTTGQISLFILDEYLQYITHSTPRGHFWSRWNHRNPYWRYFTVTKQWECVNLKVNCRWLRHCRYQLVTSADGTAKLRQGRVSLASKIRWQSVINVSRGFAYSISPCTCSNVNNKQKATWKKITIKLKGLAQAKII